MMQEIIDMNSLYKVTTDECRPCHAVEYLVSLMD